MARKRLLNRKRLLSNRASQKPSENFAIVAAAVQNTL